MATEIKQIPFRFERLFDESLIKYETFESKLEIDDYVANNPTRYAGQPLIDKSNSKLYLVNITKDGVVEIGNGGDNRFAIVAKYSELPTGADTPSTDMLFYVKEDEVDAVDTSVTHKKGFYFYDLVANDYAKLESNVETFTETIPTLSGIGALSKGSVIFGKTDHEILQMALFPETAPVVEITAPTAENSVYEIGTTIGSLPITANVTKMSYDIDSVTISVDGVQIEQKTGDDVKTGTSVTTAYTHGNADTNFEIQVDAVAGTTSSQETKQVIFTRSVFYGTDSVNETAYTSSDEIRSLANSKLNCKAKDKFTLTIANGTKMITIAVPSTLSVSSVIYRELMNSEVVGTFSQSTVSVEGANGYTGSDYKVYTYIPSVPFSSEVHYDVTLA